MIYEIAFTNKFYSDFFYKYEKFSQEIISDIKHYIFNNLLLNKKRILSFDGGIIVHKLEIRNKKNLGKRDGGRLLTFIYMVQESNKDIDKTRIIPVKIYDVNEEERENKNNSNGSYGKILQTLLVQGLNSGIKDIYKYDYKNGVFEELK